MKRSQQNLRTFDLRLQVIDTESDVRQITHRTVYGAVGLKAEKLDPSRMLEGVGYPYLCRFNVHFSRLFVRGWDADVIERAHTFKKAYRTGGTLEGNPD
jgi:hypothetical protein